MDEIKVGKYGRTNLGKIIRFAWIEDEPGIISNKRIVDLDKIKETVNHFYYFKKDEIIVKHSSNIIDLIEAGDYVNGYKVISIDYNVFDKHTECIELDLNNNYKYNFITISQIKSIVTKEQFEKMEYRIGDNNE